MLNVRLSRFIVALTLTVLLKPGVCAPPTTSETTTAPALRMPGAIAPTILRILGIGQGHQPVLPLIKIAIDAYTNGDLRAADRAIDQLTDTIVHGEADLDAYSRSIIEEAHLKINSGAGNLPGATMGDRLRGVVQVLWERARASEVHDPARAAQFARSALALASQEHFEFRYGFLRPFLQLDLDEFCKIAQLNDSQAQDLKKLSKSVQQYYKKVIGPLRPAQNATDRIVALPANQPIPQAMVDESLRLVLIWKSTIDDDPDYEIDVVREACILKNLGRAHISQNLIAASTALLEAWKKDTQDPTLIRWLDEALHDDEEYNVGPRSIVYKPGDPQYEQINRRKNHPGN